MSNKYPRGEVHMDIAENKHKLVFRSKAIAVIEDMMDCGLIKLFTEGKAGGIRFATICLYAGKLVEKEGGKARAWTYDSACRLLDTHQMKGGNWTDIANAAFEAILENHLPEMKEAMDAELAARAAEEGYVEGDLITEVRDDPSSTLGADV